MKTKKYIKRQIGLTILIISLVLSGCSSTQQIISKWKTNNIKIDGNVSDWQGNLLNIEDKKFSIGFQNDEKFLYMCLIVDDPFKAVQMMRAGFIIWFVPDDNSKMLGIKYPLGISDINIERNERINWRNEMPNRDGNFNLEKIFNRSIEHELNFQIINKDKYPLWQYPLDNQKGIKPKLSVQSNKLIYELQIPISTNTANDFQILAELGKSLEIILETEELEIKDFAGRRDGFSAGGIDGGFQRPRVGMGVGRGFSRPEPLNYKLKVTLEKK